YITYLLFCFLALHDALPILELHRCRVLPRTTPSRSLLLCSIIELLVRLLMRIVYGARVPCNRGASPQVRDTGKDHMAAPAVPSKDRKSTRLNSSHVSISYAV